jgi:hypothetical protein
VNRVIACVVVTDPASFIRLGARTVLEWSMATLAEVRGIDAVFVFASAELRGRVASASGQRPVVVPGPVAAADDLFALDAATAPLGPAFREAKGALVISPVCPFLPVARYERCVAMLGKEDANRVVLGWEADVVAISSLSRPEKVLVPGVSAEVLGVAPGKVRRVVAPASRIESIDVCHPDNLQLARALVGCGMF